MSSPIKRGLRLRYQLASFTHGLCLLGPRLRTQSDFKRVLGITQPMKRSPSHLLERWRCGHLILRSLSIDFGLSVRLTHPQVSFCGDSSSTIPQNATK